MKHPIKIEKYDGDLRQLARDITNLRYDAAMILFVEIARNLKRDGDADRDRGRPQLASHLEKASQHMSSAVRNILLAWNICKHKIYGGDNNGK